MEPLVGVSGLVFRLLGAGFSRLHGDTNKHLAEPEISGGGWCLWHLQGFGSELQEAVNGLVQRSSRASFRTLPVLLFGSWPLNCERTVLAGRPVMRGEGGMAGGPAERHLPLVCCYLGRRSFAHLSARIRRSIALAGFPNSPVWLFH